MELRRYWSIVWRYRWVVLALPFIVGLVSAVLFALTKPSYSARMQAQLVIASPQGTPTAAQDYFRYDNYYNYLATEYAVDDMVEMINGNVFADAVAATLRGPDYGLPLRNEDVRGTFKARREHRVLIVDVTTGERERSMAIARAINLTLSRDPLKYFSKGGLTTQQGAAPIMIDQPLIAHSDLVRRGLNVVLQTVIALFAGLGLAFLLAYLDDRLRDADSTRDALGLPVLGQIPAGGRAAARGGA
jgi:capsular polysaccharide biosynthesis protein